MRRTNMQATADARDADTFDDLDSPQFPTANDVEEMVFLYRWASHRGIIECEFSADSGEEFVLDFSDVDHEGQIRQDPRSLLTTPFAEMVSDRTAQRNGQTENVTLIAYAPQSRKIEFGNEVAKLAIEAGRKAVWLAFPKGQRPEYGVTVEEWTTPPAPALLPPEKGSVLIDFDEYRVNDEAIEHLSRDPNIFQRAGVLVQITQQQAAQQAADDEIHRPLGTPTIVPLAKATLRERLTRYVRFVQPAGDDCNEIFASARPPKWCVEAIHSRGQWEHVRHLAGVVSAPVLRPDGTILQQHGYDPVSGLFLQSDIHLNLPDNPTRDDAIKASQTLLDLVCDFPFAKRNTEVYRSAWLAMLLTPAARYAFHGPAPLNLIDSNIRGSGKSKLCDLVSITHYGRDMARMSYPSSDDEMRKRITSLAMMGDSIVLIDNTDRLGCPSLDGALTATSWKDRVLGGNRVVELPLRVVWCSTGNNVDLLGDTARRTSFIKLESSLESPETRTGFKYPDLLAYAREYRWRHLSAVLVILRAYCLADRPQHGLVPWGSFEAWSSVVREAIAWLGLPDPIEGHHELAATADTEASALRNLMEVWPDIDPNREGLTTAEILDRLAQDVTRTVENQVLADVRHAIVELATPNNGPLPTARQLGNKLKHLKGRVIGGQCFDYHPKRARQRAWFIRQA